MRSRGVVMEILILKNAVRNEADAKVRFNRRSCPEKSFEKGSSFR